MMRITSSNMAAVVISTLALVFALAAHAEKDDSNQLSHHVPARLTAHWWQWVFSIPDSANPLTELTGERCVVGQHGPVWFLGGDFTGSGGPIQRTCTIPRGKSILMPVINAECSTAEGNANQDEPFLKKVRDLRDCAKALVDQVITAEASFGLAGDLDPDLEDLEVKRVRTALPFALSFPPDAVLGLGSPNPSLSIADGFWVLVPPQAPGTYELKVLGEFDAEPQDGVPDFVQDVTYMIEVVAPQ